MTDSDSVSYTTAGGRANFVAIPPLLGATAVALVGPAVELPPQATTALSSIVGILITGLMLRITDSKTGTVRVRIANGSGTPPKWAELKIPTASSRVLLAVLAGFSFALIDVLASFAAFGSLPMTDPDVVATQYYSTTTDELHQASDAAYMVAAPRLLLLSLVLAVPLSVWISHRLRRSAAVGMRFAIGIYSVIMFFIMVYTAASAGDPLGAVDYLLFVLGIVVFSGAAFLGRIIAGRTQARFDATRAV